MTVICISNFIVQKSLKLQHFQHGIRVIYICQLQKKLKVHWPWSVTVLYRVRSTDKQCLFGMCLAYSFLQTSSNITLSVSCYIAAVILLSINF